MKTTERHRREHAKLRKKYGDQAYFHTPEWQAKEHEADEAIARGEVIGPFSAQKTIAALHRAARRSGRK